MSVLGFDAACRVVVARSGRFAISIEDDQTRDFDFDAGVPRRVSILRAPDEPDTAARGAPSR